MSDTWAFGCLIWLYSWCSQISRDPIYVLWGVSHIHVECQRCLTYKSRGNPPIPLIQVDDFPPFCRGSKNWEKLPTTDPWDSKSLLYHKNIKHPCSYIYCSSHGYGFFRVNFQQPFFGLTTFPPHPGRLWHFAALQPGALARQLRLRGGLSVSPGRVPGVGRPLGLSYTVFR